MSLKPTICVSLETFVVKNLRSDPWYLSIQTFRGKWCYLKATATIEGSPASFELEEDELDVQKKTGRIYKILLLQIFGCHHVLLNSSCIYTGEVREWRQLSACGYQAV